MKKGDSDTSIFVDEDGVGQAYITPIGITKVEDKTSIIDNGREIVTLSRDDFGKMLTIIIQSLSQWGKQ